MEGSLFNPEERPSPHKFANIQPTNATAQELLEVLSWVIDIRPLSVITNNTRMYYTSLAQIIINYDRLLE